MPAIPILNIMIPMVLETMSARWRSQSKKPIYAVTPTLMNRSMSVILSCS
jgi:hypothetical protein